MTMQRYKFMRGDTQTLSFYRRDNSGATILTTPYAIYFTVKKARTAEDAVFQKVHGGPEQKDEITMDDNGRWSLKLLPDDTNEIEPGEYYFDIEVIIDEEKTDVATIAEGTINFTQDTTWVQNEV